MQRLLGLAFLAAHCARAPQESVDVDLAYHLTPDPPRLGAATLHIALTEAQRPAVGAAVVIEANMTHPGMVPAFVQAREVSPGRYSAGFEFTMRGDWFVRVAVTLSDGLRIERQILIPAIRGR